MSWIGPIATAFGSTVALCALLFAVMTRRADAISRRIDGAYSAIDRVKEDAATGVDRAKHEAAEALYAHSQRTDSRIEAGRQELNTQVQLSRGRIERLSESTAHKDDVQKLGERITQLQSSMTERLDRIIENQRTRV